MSWDSTVRWREILFGIALITIPERIAVLAKDFSTKVVDELGRPVAGATVNLHWLRKNADGKVDAVELANAITDIHGKARGSFPKKALPKGEGLWLELSKAGYS